MATTTLLMTVRVFVPDTAANTMVPLNVSLPLAAAAGMAGAGDSQGGPSGQQRPFRESLHASPSHRRQVRRRPVRHLPPGNPHMQSRAPPVMATRHRLPGPPPGPTSPVIAALAEPGVVRGRARASWRPGRIDRDETGITSVSDIQPSGGPMNREAGPVPVPAVQRKPNVSRLARSRSAGKERAAWRVKSCGRRADPASCGTASFLIAEPEVTPARLTARQGSCRSADVAHYHELMARGR